MSWRLPRKVKKALSLGRTTPRTDRFMFRLLRFICSNEIHPWLMRRTR